MPRFETTSRGIGPRSERIEAERINTVRDKRPAPVYAPGEPKLTITKCLILATSTTAGKEVADITPDFAMAWTAKAVQHRMTLAEIVSAFDYVSDSDSESSRFFPTWNRILAAVHLHRSFADRITDPPGIKALPEPVTADQRKVLAGRMDALTVARCVNPQNAAKRFKPRARAPAIITDEQRADGQRQIERLRG